MKLEARLCNAAIEFAEKLIKESPRKAFNVDSTIGVGEGNEFAVITISQASHPSGYHAKLIYNGIFYFPKNGNSDGRYKNYIASKFPQIPAVKRATVR